MLFVFFLVGKTYARYYLYQPVSARPAITRSNEALKTIDLAAWAALIGGFFFTFNPDRPFRAITIAGGLVLYDIVIRQMFLRIEIHRIQRQSPDRKWRYRDARRRVRRRAESAMFH